MVGVSTWTAAAVAGQLPEAAAGVPTTYEQSPLAVSEVAVMTPVLRWARISSPPREAPAAIAFAGFAVLLKSASENVAVTVLVALSNFPVIAFSSVLLAVPVASRSYDSVPSTSRDAMVKYFVVP